MSTSPYHLFDAIGVELEYMIVDRESFDVRPIADELLKAAAVEHGSITPNAPPEEQPSDFDFEGATWSNELASHVIEIKTEEPARTLLGLAPTFQLSVEKINALLAQMHARLMPGGMHPWMDPEREMVLWKHDYSPVYDAFDRLFGCKGHGWANLQSVHINLPFAGDEEFARLHAAIRLLLPILPALAASSPAMDGKLTGLLDNRLEVYRTNSRKMPSMTGRVIPEPVFTHADYDREIFQPIFRDLKPHDPEGILQHEWANARGAIARFSRGSIEIRVLDVQECPRADLAMVGLIVSVLKDLVNGKWSTLEQQKQWGIEPLEKVFLGTLRDAEQFRIDDAAYLKALGFSESSNATAGELWRHLYSATTGPFAAPDREALDVMLNKGPLARRMLGALGPMPDRRRFQSVCVELTRCLAEGRMFLGTP